MKLIAFKSIVAAALLVATAGAHARVERVEILSRSDVLEAKAFGDVGAYEKHLGYEKKETSNAERPTSNVEQKNFVAT